MGKVKPRSRRTRVIELTGQKLVPTIAFGDGTAYREESKNMTARIRAGKLFEGTDSPGPGPNRT